MAWEQEATRIPTSIGTILITLADPDGNNDNREIDARVQVLDQTGALMKTWSGDAKPHLPGAVLTALAGTLDDIRTEAEDKLL